MNRKQKRAKSFRRRHHQKVTATGTKVLDFPDGSRIEVARGPKPAESYRRKRKKSPAEIADDHLRDVFGNVPISPAMRKEFSRLARAVGGYEKAKEVLSAPVASARERKMEVRARAGGKSKQQQNVIAQADSLRNGSTIAMPDGGPMRPSHGEIEAMIETGRRKKRGRAGYIKAGTDLGWALIADDADPKLRDSWTVG